MRHHQCKLMSVMVAGIIGLASAADAAADEHRFSRSIDNVEWIDAEPGVSFGLLWGDWERGPFGMIVKTQAGYTIPQHTHAYDYDGVTIQGNWVHVYGKDDARVLKPGSYAFQKAGEFHLDRCDGPVDCLVLIHQHGARTFIPPGD